MKPLYRTQASPESMESIRRTLMNKDNEWWRRTYDMEFLDEASKLAYINSQLNKDKEVWANETYCVHMESVGEIVHLSIKRHDREPCLDWRDKQQIKNQLVGPECEGVELYPAESRVVDTANQFHLWVHKDPNMRFPVGFDTGFKTDEPLGRSKQRKL